jgi:outer membrane protein OmpA-like peptidoglycan-associated protein
MKKIIFLTIIFLYPFLTSSAQSFIQWNKDLKFTENVNFLHSDSSQLNSNLFLSRRIIMDSLNDVAKEKRISFHDRTYVASFEKPEKISQLLINSSKPIFGSIIYVKVYDQKGKPHLVYDHRNAPLCQDTNDQILMISIPPTLYEINKVEIGAVIHNNFIKKIGISNEADGNRLLRELALNGYTNICLKSSFIAEKQNLGLAINSSFDEVKPIISPDGKTLLFCRQFHPNNTGGKKDDQDIYYSTSKDGLNWSFAKNIGSPLNNKFANGICAITPDGNTLLLLNKYLPHNKVEQGVSISKNTLEGWSFPEALNIHNFENYSGFADYYLSVSKKELILAVEADDSEGEQDLYVSFYDEENNTWTTPLNLGPNINTMLNEYGPFLAADGVTLYFASEGHLGYGGADLFVSKRLDDTWTKWSEPENLGPIVNSWGDDSYYTIPASGTHAYFVTTTEAGGKDIFRIALPKQFKPSPVALLSGKIFDNQTGKPEEVQIKIFKENSKKLFASASSNPVTGNYKIALTAGSNYLIDFYQEQQKVHSIHINCKYLLDFKEITEDIYLNTDSLYKADQSVSFSKETIQRPQLAKTPVLFKGKIFSSTARPLNAELRFEELSSSEKTHITTNPSTGYFKTILNGGNIYKATLLYEQNIVKIDTIDFSEALHYMEENKSYILGDSLLKENIILGYKYYANLNQEQKKNLTKQKKKDFKAFKSFGSKHNNLPEDLVNELEHFAEFLHAAPQFSISIKSYSDSRGGGSDKLTFESQERARICAEFFKAAGISESRIAFKGYGYEMPLAGNWTRKGRAKNLRIEIALLKN